MKIKKEKGTITLEACVTLIMFTFLMLFWSGLMIIYTAQGDMSHTLLETAESMSLDPYAIERLNTTGANIESELGTYISQLVTEIFGNNSSNPYFATDKKWYKSTDSSSLSDVAKKRFIGYFSNGDENKAEDILKYFNVVNGLSGLDFSESKVENGDLYLTIKYELEYEYNVYSLLKIPVKQTIKVKLFK